MQSNPILTNNAVRPPPIYIIIMIIISMTGPALLNLITDARQPYTLQRACWIGLLFLTGGWLIISLVQTFPQFLMGTFVRTMVRIVMQTRTKRHSSVFPFDFSSQLCLVIVVAFLFIFYPQFKIGRWCCLG